MSFPKDFLWGAASSSYQIEGAWNEDGKLPGIWDALSFGHVKHNEDGAEACDHYHRYKEDVAIMKELGLKSYRFSISWPRVMNEKKEPIPGGIKFYSDLIDELLAAGITPMITVYHWDLPMWVHELGGWKWEGISDLFAEYTKLVVDSYSDRVKYWMTINEPQVFIGLGYQLGIHAPFEKVDNDTLADITKNVLLAHGKSARTIKKYAKQDVLVGTAFTGVWKTPWDETEEGIEEARKYNYCCESFIFSTPYWADPVLLGEFHPEALAKLGKTEPFITPEEMDIIHAPIDFFGYNIYRSCNYDDVWNGRNPRQYRGMPRNALEWNITPEVMYWSVRMMYERYKLPIMITENGTCDLDMVYPDGKIHDNLRQYYIQSYLGSLKRAVDEGYPVLGYQYWSLMDNFEWAEGYDKRLGLVYIDYRDYKRILKDSAFIYKDIVATNGENLKYNLYE